MPQVVRDFEDLVVPGLGEMGKPVVPKELHQSPNETDAEVKKHAYNK